MKQDTVSKFQQRLTADPHWLPQLRCYCCQDLMMSSLSSPPLTMSLMSLHVPDVRPHMRCGPGPGWRGTETPGPGAGAWPGRPGALLPPLPATRSQGIIIAITQDLNQAAVLTSLVLSGSVIMSLDEGRSVFDPYTFYSSPSLEPDFRG